MSTPRTDAMMQDARPVSWQASYGTAVLLARTLERELTEARQELATERARLDWLESDAGMEFQWETTKVITRAAIDAAIKEGTK